MSIRCAPTPAADWLRIVPSACAYNVAVAGKISLLSDMLHQRCPRCRSGQIFRGSAFLGFPKMNTRCPVCELRFEREAGYFLGAMYISYGLALVVIAVFAAALWYMTGWWITKATVWATFLFLPLAPAITYLSRVLWIYFDQTMDPDRS